MGADAGASADAAWWSTMWLETGSSWSTSWWSVEDAPDAESSPNFYDLLYVPFLIIFLRATRKFIEEFIVAPLSILLEIPPRKSKQIQKNPALESLFHSKDSIALILRCAAASFLRDESHFSSNRILASTSPKGRRFRLEASTHRQIHRKRLSTRHRHSHVNLRCGGAVVAAVDVVVAGLLERMAKPTERVVHQVVLHPANELLHAYVAHSFRRNKT